MTVNFSAKSINIYNSEVKESKELGAILNRIGRIK